MPKIVLKVDGEEYRDLCDAYARQLVHVIPAMRRYRDVDGRWADLATAYAEARAGGPPDEALADLRSLLASTREERLHAYVAGMSVADPALRTATDLVTCLLRDNAAELDGLNARHRKTIELIDGALPPSIRVNAFTCVPYECCLAVSVTYVSGKPRTCGEYDYLVHCCYENTGIISEEAARSNVFTSACGDEVDFAAVEEQLKGYRDAVRRMRDATEAYNAAADEYRAATSLLYGAKRFDRLRGFDEYGSIG